jgi:uncharacterized BrkB/YihY/UPF0761 family membrane protein
VPDDEPAEPAEPADEPTAQEAETTEEAESRLERLRASVDHARDVLEAKRGTSTTVSVAYDAFGHDVEAGGPVLAAALGFRVFLFMVPYVGFFLFVGAFVSTVFDRSSSDLFRGTGISALVANGIHTSDDLSTGAKISAFVLVVYALFLSSRSFVKVLRIVHTLIWHMEPTRMRRSTFATFVFLGMVTAEVVLLGLIDALRTRSVIGGVFALILFTGVPFVVWWMVSWWLPHGDCDRLGLMPGAALFAIGAEAIQVFTVVYLPHSLQSKSELYGALGTALVLLFWAYLIGRLIAFCAALNVALWKRRPADGLPLPSFVTKIPLLGGRIDDVWRWLLTSPGFPGQPGASAPSAPSPS